jgi:FkbM family methyltransferase
MRFADVGKRIAAMLGLEVKRGGQPNRFDAMAASLRSLRAHGYIPRVVIDGGANVGAWTRLAAAVFPEAQFHLIEPQFGCQAELARLGQSRRIHPVVITRPGVCSIPLASIRFDGLGTGAFAVKPGDKFGEEVHVADYPATTLDALFGDIVSEGDRTLMKLDLEGHEIDALEGASALLPRIEVIISEVSFFDVYAQGHRLFSDVLTYLAARGFVLYDLAALAGRRRDNRLKMGDAIFVRNGSPLLDDASWE